LWLLAFGLVQYIDFTELACTSSLLSYFWHYVEDRTGLRIKSGENPLFGEVELFSFFLWLFFGCWHLDWSSILISRNRRARRVRSFTFDIALRTEQGCPYSLRKIPLSGEVELFSFFEGLSCGCWHLE